MGSYSGTCEIVEARGEPRSVRGSEQAYESCLGPSLDAGDRKPPMLKLGCKDSLEDDLDQLFGAISLRHPKSSGLQCQAGTNASLLRESAMKRPITVGVPRSPGIGNSESVSLKQALRELCISKASEMAAMKRLSQSINSPRISEAGRIKSLYKLVVVETTKSVQPSGDGKGTVVETSLGPEVSMSNSSGKMPQQQHMSRIKSSSKSAHSTPRFLGSKSPNQSMLSSPRIGVPATEYTTRTTIMSNEIVSSSRRVGTQDLKVPNQSAVSSPTFVDPKTQTYMEVTLTRNETGSASRRVGNQASKSAYKSTYSFSRHAVPTAQNGSGSAPIQNDIGSASRKVGGQASKMEILPKEKCTSATSLTCSNSIDNARNPDVDIPTMLIAKTACKAPARPGWKVRIHVAPASSINRHRVSKSTRNTSRIRPVMRNKTFVKKKVKPGTVATARNSDEGNRSLVHGTSLLVCQKCQCSLNNAAEDSNQVFLDSFSVGPSAEVSTGSMNSGASKTEFTSSNCNPSRALGKAKKNSKSREEGEFSQTSKSSGYNTSTSNSYESNASRSSCGNRPHMSKDFRWQAIGRVKMQDGVLSLKHFNLLKKLGGGDIGTVYLAELIGSKCLFAIKVMDNEFLARRKKMARAQTEREILRMLDHPFLPTLYAQFRSDHLSCFVMEYCPGGDLHVLRQKQLGRCFPEEAARFYVAEVLLALEYLHMLGVIYRDLKPENVLVREDGHVMLADFDLSLRCSVSPTLLKSPSTDPVHVRMSAPCTARRCIEPFCTGPSCQVPCFSPRFLAAAAKARKLKAAAAAQVRSLPQLVAEPTDARSNSFVGTHEYLAPEIIRGEGHGAAVDWWTFGVFLYELLYGITPFKGPGNEETLANVVSRSLTFPDSPLVSFQARDLIRGLLAKEPENRVGSKKGAAEIKQHPFFEGLNWALIRCTIPPELPEFYDFEEKSSGKCLGFQATAEHLEFELF